MTGQSKAKYKQHHLPLEGLECRNSKSSPQKLQAFKCEYLNFHTVYGRGTLRIYLYSPPGASQVLIKSEIWPKMWLEGENISSCSYTLMLYKNLFYKHFSWFLVLVVFFINTAVDCYNSMVDFKCFCSAGDEPTRRVY